MNSVFQKVESLSGGRQQSVAIARAISFEPRVVILDEPTANLSVMATERLLETMVELKQQGVAQIIISHRLTDIFEVGDRVMVLKRGENVGDRYIAHTNEHEVLRDHRLRHPRDRADGGPGRGAMSAAPPAAEPGMATEAAGWQHIVRLERVQKYFGAIHALRDIDLAVGRNEIVGLIGDNGAGKSTLIKVLTGVLPPTSGRIFVRDRELDLADYSVRMAHDLSIETVYQDKSLAEKQPLWRNFFAGRQITNRWGFIDIRRQKAIAEQILREAIGFRGVGITVDSTVANLSGGERQGIAIGRAMHYNADLIVLDEPTVALAVAEVRKVLDFVRRIKEGGRSCIYIEHSIAHVHAVADRLVILDRGSVVAEVVPKDMSVIELTEFLIDLQHSKA